VNGTEALVQLSCPIDSRGSWNSPNLIYTMDLVLERVGRTPTAPGSTASFGCSQCLDSIRSIPPPGSGFWAGRRRLPEGCRPLGIVELVRFHQVGCEGSGQVLRVRSAAMDPDAVSTPHRFSGDERLRSNPRPGVTKSWGCPWFPFVLELLREAAAKSLRSAKGLQTPPFDRP